MRFRAGDPQTKDSSDPVSNGTTLLGVSRGIRNRNTPVDHTRDGVGRVLNGRSVVRTVGSDEGLGRFKVSPSDVRVKHAEQDGSPWPTTPFVLQEPFLDGVVRPHDPRESEKM